jgi:ABC-type branched-subunit amino acid transport system substrate-binding protein
VTATTINLGVLYVSNYDQANANNGGASITGGDPLTEAQLVVREINAHGGIAGRRIVPTYVGYDRTSNLPSTAQVQAACSKLTQDHLVFAVLGAGLTLNLRACVEKAGGIDVGTSIVEDNADVFRR